MIEHRAKTSRKKQQKLVDSSSVDDSNVELPETDEDENDNEVIAPRRTRVNPLSDSESSDGEDEELRRSIYKAESEEEEPIEEQAYSKATRRSILGFVPRKSTAAPDSDSDSDSSNDILEISDEESENERDKKDIAKVSLLSSTIRSPFKDISNESFDKSIQIKMSSTVSPKEESGLLDEAAGGEEKVKVSKTQYDEAMRALGVLENKKNSMQNLIDSKNFRQLPDGGEKLKTTMTQILTEIREKQQIIDMMEVEDSMSVKSEIKKSFQSEQASVHAISIIDEENALALNDVRPVGNIGVKKFSEQKALTVGKLEELSGEVSDRPAESFLIDPPKYLKVTLMDYQRHGVAFMLWRETKQPRGGILADDMGLGKTLTTISLVLKGIQRSEDEGEDSDSDTENEDDDGWKHRGEKQFRNGGTLIVCPASLVKQWEYEITSKTKRGAIEYNVFHGPNREWKASRLAKFDVVLTTYQIAVSELKNNGCLYSIKWKRVVLDEGHVIRNHKSKQSEAVCKLMSKYRWVLSGTPIQNKEFDLYAAIKFLKCRPFDDLLYWKRYIEVNKGKESSPRVQFLLRAILLRRTKEQLVENGQMASLPTKEVEQFQVIMNREERKIYNKFMAYSQTIFATFLKQHDDKNDNYTYDKDRAGKLYKQLCKKYKVDREIKAHEILTLLLRLRQICCHPGLTKGSLEKYDGEAVEGEAQNEYEADESVGLMQEFDKLNLHGDEDDDDNGNDDDVYNLEIPSSKIHKMMEVYCERVLETDDKAIIVSQWTGYLKIIAGMLDTKGVRYCELNGTVPVKDRNDIVVDFNKPTSRNKVMLLSLTAGGVGLNLAGANYLFFMDLHWNPQLEQQAQDRIYRYGQKKDVKIFK